MLEINNQKLIAGARWNWRDTISGYPATEYTLKVYLKKDTGTTITITTSQYSSDTNQHETDIAAATTAAYESGFYYYTAVLVEIDDATNIIPYEDGVVEVLANLTSVSDGDTFAMNMVNAIRNALLALEAKTMQNFTIDGRSYQYKDIDLLTGRLEYWEGRAGVSKTNKRKRILTQFTND